MAKVGDYNLPDDLYYHKEHFWAKIDGDVATIGIDEFGTKLAGEISFIELPMEDDEVDAGGQCGSLETGKAADMILNEYQNQRLVQEYIGKYIGGAE